MSTLAVLAKLGILFLFPFAVLIVGGLAMGLLADPDDILQRRQGFVSRASETKPLNMRWGYDVDAVRKVWGDPGNKPALDVQRRLLEFDLFFPFVYGFALALGLWIAWPMLGRPFWPGWLVVPVAMAMLADWTENLVQLRQLARYSGVPARALQDGWIQAASIATITKLTFFSGSWVFLLALVLTIGCRYFRAG
jgi:hypothetical protein